MTQALHDKKLWKICQAFLFVNITNELFPALEFDEIDFTVKAAIQWQNQVCPNSMKFNFMP